MMLGKFPQPLFCLPWPLADCKHHGVRLTCIHLKVYTEKLAVALKLPIIKLTDGSSGGGSVTSIKKMGWSYVPGVPGFIEAIKGLNMGIPNLAAVLGPAVSFRRQLTCRNTMG